MKPFSAIDITLDEENDIENGQEFISVKTSAELQTELKKVQNSILNSIDKFKFPIGKFDIFIVVCMVADLAFGTFLDITCKSKSISESYHAYPWAFWLCGLCLIVAVILDFYKRKKEKEVDISEGLRHGSSKIEKVAERIYAELEVPQNALTVDVLSFEYKLKNDKIMPERDMPYVNAEYKAYIDGDCLYLVNTEGKYRFPLPSFRRICKVKKTITLFSWNKAEKSNKGEYKQYRISYNADSDEIKIKWYYILEFDYGGEQWGIYIPNYELPAFQKLTGLSAE